MIFWRIAESPPPIASTIPRRDCSRSHSHVATASPAIPSQMSAIRKKGILDVHVGNTHHDPISGYDTEPREKQSGTSAAARKHWCHEPRTDNCEYHRNGNWQQSEKPRRHFGLCNQ